MQCCSNSALTASYFLFSSLAKLAKYHLLHLPLHIGVYSPDILQVFPFILMQHILSNCLIHLGHSDWFEKSGSGCDICTAATASLSFPPLFYIQENFYATPLFLLFSPSCMFLARPCHPAPHRFEQTCWLSLSSKACIVHRCFLHLFSILNCSPSVYSSL